MGLADPDRDRRRKAGSLGALLHVRLGRQFFQTQLTTLALEMLHGQMIIAAATRSRTAAACPGDLRNSWNYAHSFGHLKLFGKFAADGS